MKNKITQILLTATCGLYIPHTFAQNIQPMSFDHGEWELVCSNTGTCRAAGYQSDNHENVQPASILMTRKAGMNEPVQVEYALALYEDEEVTGPIYLFLNNQNYGVVSTKDDPFNGQLNAKQTQALVQMSHRQVKIEFKNQHQTWLVSDEGMTAVLLKMDDFQKRLGTTEALVRKGQRSEQQVLKAQPKLLVKRIQTDEAPYLELDESSPQYKHVLALLMDAKPQPVDEYDSCEGVYDSEQDKLSLGTIYLYKLSHQKVLATALCWRGAYNEGYGAWVLNDSLKGPATFVTDRVSGVLSGELLSAQKGRGLGDCWSHDQWIWNGQQFIHTQESWSGACKGFLGGAWDLVQIESEIH